MMEEQSTNQGWWQTLPGVITKIVGLITAIAGLIAALQQIGVFQLLSQQKPIAGANSVVPMPSLPEALKRNTYEFGWSEDAYRSMDRRIEYYTVEDVRVVSNDFVTFRYARRGGGKVQATLHERTLKGTWSQGSEKGELELTFEDETCARAVGWWNYGGQTKQYNTFMRRIQ